MLGMALYALATPPGSCAMNSAGSFFASVFVSAVDPVATSAAIEAKQVPEPHQQ